MRKPYLTPLAEFRSRENRMFLALTIVVAVLTGLVAVLFSVAIDLTSRVLFGLDPSSVRLFLVPALVSVASGILLATRFRDVRGSGVPQTKAAYHLHGGAIPARVPIGKFVMGVLCVGSGHSMGREGPSVQIGAGLASVVGRWMRLSPARAKEIVPVGVAGALAAAFNTPIAAVLFTLEEIVGDMNATVLGSTVVASVTAVVVERAILGNEPLFHVPAYHLEHPAELLVYAVLGVLGGAISVVFCRALLGARAAFLALPESTRPYQPALGGVAVGLILIVVPQVMGVGYETVDRALNGGLALQTLGLLCLAKVCATIVSYSSGNAGGIFAPSLFIGAMVGGAIGIGAGRVAPFVMAESGAYALVGMGTLFAGIIRAPMTSVFMVFEITQDYQIVVPLMVANLLSFWISRHYQRTPVYEALLHQDGVHLPASGAEASGERWTAADIMSDPGDLIPGELTVVEAAALLSSTNRVAAAIGRPGALEGVLLARDLDLESLGLVRDAARPCRTHVHPDQPFSLVVARYRESEGVLPVVTRDNVRDVVGLITQEELELFLKRPMQRVELPRG